MHTPSKLALDTLSELQRQAVSDYGLGPHDPKALMAGAEVAGQLAQLRGVFDNHTKRSWLSIIRKVVVGENVPTASSPHQDTIEKRLIDNAHSTLLRRTAHISNVDMPTRVLLASIAIGQSNAITIAISETDEYIVLLQRGLFGTLNLLARIVAMAWPEPDEPGGPLPILIDRDAALARMKRKEIGHYVVDVLEHCLLKGDPQSMPVLPMPANRDGLKETILLHAEMFVIGHEFGHIIRSHFSGDRDEITRRGNLALTVKSRSHQEEFGADLSAFELLTAACTQDPAALCLSYYGCRFFLSVQDLLEQAISLVPQSAGQPRFRDTHPSGAKRSAAITNVMRSHLGLANTKVLENAYGVIQSILDYAWELARDDWTRLLASGALLAPAWESALECQRRPDDRPFEVEEADTTLKALGLPDSEGLEGIKGNAFLPLLDFFCGDNNEGKDDAAKWLLENAHVTVICLIHELGREPNDRGAKIVDHLVTQETGLTTWLNTLRFIVERYSGNADILGVPEVLPQVGVGVSYLQRLAEKHLARASPDYVRSFMESARESHLRTFGGGS